MRHNHENRPLSQSSEADDNALDPPTDEPATESSALPNPEMGRRGYLGLLGGGVGAALLGSDSVSAESAGYGAGEYGLGEYGGTESESDDSPSQPPEESDDDADEDSLPDVLTVSADPEPSAATLSGLIWTLGDADSASAYFEYRAVDTEEWAETDASTQSTWGTFTRTVTDLEPATAYEYRAVAAVGDDASVGKTQTFQTLAADQSAPSVDKLSITDVSSTDSDLELLVDWEVSDPDGDLKTVSVLISDGDSTLEWHDIPASGSTAHGSQALSVAADDEKTYKITVAVTNGAGNRDFASERRY